MTLSGATAQVMATALAMYVTDSGLAGGTGASADGFTVTTTGMRDRYLQRRLEQHGHRPVQQHLVQPRHPARYADSAASGGFTTAESNAVTAIFTAINTAGTSGMRP